MFRMICFLVANQLLHIHSQNHEHAKDMKGMVPVLIKILQQVVDGKLPKGYSYHGTPAPWIQIRCLQIMAQLGHDDLRYQLKPLKNERTKWIERESNNDSTKEQIIISILNERERKKNRKGKMTINVWMWVWVRSSKISTSGIRN